MNTTSPSAAAQVARDLEYAAYHEAGHAVAYWATGVLPYRVAIAPSNNEIIDRRDRAVRCTGLTEASRINPIIPFDKYPPSLRRSAYVQAQLEAVCSYAGPIAEARISRQSILLVLLRGGAGDFQKIQELLAWISISEAKKDELHLVTERAALRLLRRDRYWPAVECVAEALMERRDLEGKEIDRLICSVMKREQPAFFPPEPWLRLLPYRKCRPAVRRPDLRPLGRITPPHRGPARPAAQPGSPGA